MRTYESKRRCIILKISGEVVYNYDRGLDVPPQNEAAEMALAILMHEYN